MGSKRLIRTTRKGRGVDIFPVILCGGSGTRLWPASSFDQPKPFIPLLDARSSLQHTAARLAGLPGGRSPIVVVGVRHVALVRRQLADIGIEAFVIAEPESRDTGPALLAAARWVTRSDPRGLILAVAADHHIPDAAAFRASISSGVAAAEQGYLVTFGVTPTFPASSYGYIRPGAALAAGASGRRVEAFIEKPDIARAEAFVAAGYLWNSGDFIFRADTLLGEAALHAPAMDEAVRQAVDGGTLGEGVFELGSAFAAAPAGSIDLAVMETTSRAAVLQTDFVWSDLGAWDAVWAASDHDGAGNVIRARAVVAGSTDCLIRAGGAARIVAVGLRRIAIVVEGDKILVGDLATPGQALKDAVARLDEE